MREPLNLERFNFKSLHVINVNELKRQENFKYAMVITVARF